MDTHNDVLFQGIRNSYLASRKVSDFALFSWSIVIQELLLNFPQLRVMEMAFDEVDLDKQVQNKPFAEYQHTDRDLFLKLFIPETDVTYAWVGPSDEGYFRFDGDQWHKFILSGVLEGNHITLAHAVSRPWSKVGDIFLERNSQHQPLDYDFNVPRPAK